jgi:LysM repeat protein
MNSIRPLVTITILVVVGAFLYVKINQGPVRPVSATSDAWSNPTLEDVPPLSPPPAAAPQASTPPPAFSADAPAAPVAAEPVVSIEATIEPPSVPSVPAIPEVAEIATAAPPAAAATASVSPPTELPANIPTAQYPDQPAPVAPAPPTEVAVNQTPPPIITPDVPDPIAPPPVAQQPATPATPEEANDIDIAATNISTPPLTADQNPLRQSSPPTAGDRYATDDRPTEPTNPEPPAAAAQQSFATTWPEIQAVLNQGNLARAHELLSPWHNHPSLTPTDAEMVDTLLSQLAGTVIYSNEHQLEPAYVARPGDTLDSVARECNVPWQLLAKINGIASAGELQPGQELKVVRGPFSAVIDVGRKQLTLMVGQRYAGEFPITVPAVAAVGEGQWIVETKDVVPAEEVTQSAYTPGAAAVDRAIVLRADSPAGSPASAAKLTIASSGGTANSSSPPPAIRLSPQDAEELSDILSIGSRVVIRR